MRDRRKYLRELRQCRKENGLCSQCDAPAIEGTRMCAKHKALFQNRASIRRKILRDWCNNYKKSHPCARCGFTDYRALQFHHVDPIQKNFEIGIGIVDRISIEDLQKEVEKCIILCANCHMIEHFKELPN